MSAPVIPHPAIRLALARDTISHPSQVCEAVVLDACDLLIRDGSADDVRRAWALRSSIVSAAVREINGKVETPPPPLLASRTGALILGVAVGAFIPTLIRVLFGV